jgi:hypothetical protein
MAMKNIYSQKSMGWKKYQNSGVMKKILSNPKIAATLDRQGERSEFYKDLKGMDKGGVTKNELKEVFGKYMAGKGKTISCKEASIVAGEMFKGESGRYISPKSDAVKSDPSANRVSTANQSENFNAARTESSASGAGIIARSKIPSGLAASIASGGSALRLSNSFPRKANEENKGSFSRALSAMRRNKGS